MIARIILALLGILISFLVKFKNREAAHKDWSMKFWAKDNYPEVITSTLMVIALMILTRNATFSSEWLMEKVPWVTGIPLDEAAALVIGYYNNVAWYALFKTKVTQTEEKLS